MSNNSDFIISLSFIHSKIMKQIDNNLSLHGISFSEFMVMYYLNNSPGNTMKRINLAESIGLTASGVTRLLNPMEKRKLIQKEANPRDARVSLVKLSKAGEEIFKDAMASFKQISDSILKPLNKKQTTQISESIRLLI